MVSQVAERWIFFMVSGMFLIPLALLQPVPWFQRFDYFSLPMFLLAQGAVFIEIIKPLEPEYLTSSSETQERQSITPGFPKML